MPYDETLAERVRKALGERKDLTEKRMFGGITFMLGSSMCCGVVKSDLMVRVDPARHEELLAQPLARPMDFTGRPMKGFLFIGPGERLTDRDLESWVQEALDYAARLPPKHGRKAPPR